MLDILDTMPSLKHLWIKAYRVVSLKIRVNSVLQSIGLVDRHLTGVSEVCRR